jgi:nucleoside-diphosphate-sugar epimerase
MSDVFGKYKDIQRRIPDLTKAKNILGYSPKFKLSDAIKITIDTIKNTEK